MKDFTRYKKIGSTTNTVTYISESDPDILIIVPNEGTMDNAKDARENIAFYQNYARSLGKPIGNVVIMANMLSQDAEARRVYGEADPRLAYGAGLVVESALSRALGSFFVGLSRPVVPTRLFDSVENAVAWLKTMRPK